MNIYLNLIHVVSMPTIIPDIYSGDVHAHIHLRTNGMHVHVVSYLRFRKLMYLKFLINLF